MMQSSAHKLAAIVFTDIVGYTSITQENEQKAWQLVQKHEKAIESITKEYGGEVLNYYGDGSLSTFPSVTDAIEAAGRVQEKMQEEPKVPLRIGIHLGEIYFKDGKFLGDGINIASRIQSEAEEGQIYISEAIYQTAKNKPNFTFEEVGISQLKNVDRPVKIHRVQVSQFLGASSVKKSKKRHWIYWLAAIVIIAGATFFVGQQSSTSSTRSAEQIPSILILPFEDQNPEDEESLFGLGIADEVRSKLSGIQQLDVKSRSSAMFLKDKNWTAKDIADKFDVQYILEGSTRQNQNRINLNLSLINAELDKVIQPIEYQTSLNQDFIVIQNELAQIIISLIKIKLLPEEEKNLARVETENLAAYKYYLMGKYFMGQSSMSESLTKAEQYFKKAIQEDPTFTKAYAHLAEALFFPAGFGIESISTGLSKARPYAEKAYRLDPNSAESNHAMGIMHLYSENFLEAGLRLEQAFKMDPTNDLSLFHLAWIKSAAGEHNKAISYIREAIQLNPFSPITSGQLVGILMQAERFEEAIEVADSFLVEFPDHIFLLFYKGVALTMHGNFDAAIETFLKRDVATREYNWALGYAHGVKGDTLAARLVLDYLLKKSKRQYIPPAMIASVYLGLGEIDEVYEWLAQEESYYFKMFPYFTGLRQDPKLREAYTFMQPFLD